ncbi:MAG TPA: M48 family metalloprotease [Acidimicrobiales bacterium]|nr:M48 family metalloprotease [Acidimicrobiales bacterium]
MRWRRDDRGVSSSTVVPAPSPYQLAAGPVPGSRRRAVTLLAGAAFPIPVLLFVILVFVAGPIVAAVVAVLGWAVVAALLVRNATRRVLAALDAFPADPVHDARLHNLTESLCVAAGLPKPTLLVVSDDRPNSLSLGLSPRSAVVVVTRGVTTGFNRLEMEAVLAHELSHVRRGDPALATAIGAVGGPLLAIAPRAMARLVLRLGGDHESAADVAAVGLTRYPPALIAALERMRPEVDGTATRRRAVDRLWNVPRTRPEAGSAATTGGASDALECRIEALLEL